MTSKNMPQSAVTAYRALPLLASAGALVLAAGCSDDPTEPGASAGSAAMAGAATESGAAGGGGEGGGGDTTPPLYAVSTTVFDDTNAATYVALMDSLDDRQIDLAQAAEFAGWSSVATLGGALFVGHGEMPEVSRYPVDEGGRLGEADSTVLSFAAFGLSTASFSFNTFVDATAAHMTLEQTSRIIWNPSSLEIAGSVATPEVAMERDGLSVNAANFQGRVVQGDRVLQPYFWRDADWFQFHQSSQIGIYSRSGELQALLDAPCPALQIATQDEGGNTYLTGMVDTIGYQLTADESLQRCAVRIDAGTHEIAEGWPRQFEDLTEGRPSGVFHYLENGVGVLTVYHMENADPSSETFLDDWHRANWGLWLVDLNAWTAEPITQWELGGSNVFFSRADGRLFLHRVEADFSQTIIYEITSDGGITEQLTVPGYAAYPILRVR